MTEEMRKKRDSEAEKYAPMDSSNEHETALEQLAFRWGFDICYEPITQQENEEKIKAKDILLRSRQAIIDRGDLKCDDFHRVDSLLNELEAVSEVEKLNEALSVAEAALRGANTYLRDIMQLQKTNITGYNYHGTDAEAFSFAKDIASSGYRESSEALAKIRELQGENGCRNP